MRSIFTNIRLNRLTIFFFLLLSLPDFKQCLSKTFDDSLIHISNQVEMERQSPTQHLFYKGAYNFKGFIVNKSGLFGLVINSENVQIHHVGADKKTLL